jgi:hypothetical protein
MRRLATCFWVLPAAAVLAAAGSAGGNRLDPYKSLRTSPWPDTALPAAFSSAKASAAAPSSTARRNGATGAVEVVVDGPDANAGIVFVIFKTAGGAGADLASALPVDSALQLHASGKVPGQASSSMYSGVYENADALGLSSSQHVSYAVVHDGNVLVAGFTYAPEGLPADRGGAAALARSGVAHLKSLGG